jgi:hypothetical protein
MPPAHEPYGGMISVDPPCSLPLKVEGVSRNAWLKHSGKPYLQWSSERGPRL